MSEDQFADLIFRLQGEVILQQDAALATLTEDCNEEIARLNELRLNARTDSEIASYADLASVTRDACNSASTAILDAGRTLQYALADSLNPDEAYDIVGEVDTRLAEARVRHTFMVPRIGARSSSSARRSTGSSLTDDCTVHVRGYYRRDGTYVRPHTRRHPDCS